jgi:hypothetical protein
MIETESIRNPNAESGQSGGVCRQGLALAEAKHPITNLKLVGVYAGSHTGYNARCLESEDTNGKFNNAQCDQNILDMTC